jgi:hypothetical protein
MWQYDRTSEVVESLLVGGYYVAEVIAMLLIDVWMIQMRIARQQ